MATHSSILAQRIPGTGEPGGLLSMGSHSQTRLKRLSSSSYSFKAPSNCLEPFLDPAKIPFYSCSILYLLLLLQFQCIVVVFVFLNMWVTSYQLFVQGPAPGRLKVKVLVAQSCPSLCNPMDCSPPGFLSMEFSRQEYRSGQPFPSPGDLPDPGIKPGSPALQEYSLLSEPPGKLWLLNIFTEGERDWQLGDLSISPRFAPELLCKSLLSGP